jgi:hypothetical protein
MTSTWSDPLNLARRGVDRTCPLCGSRRSLVPVRGADARRYFLCDECRLIFVDAREHLSPQDQLARYRTHRNGIEHPGYVAFLRRIVDPMLEHLDGTMRGLDFGCGPGPTIAPILEQHGIFCANYDPLFADSALEPPYDFIFATECFEHFSSPGSEVRRLHALLRAGGCLGVMTEQWTDLPAFGRWCYTRDATHICFFHAKTFEYLCATFGFECVWTDGARALILKKRD